MRSRNLFVLAVVPLLAVLLAGWGAVASGADKGSDQPGKKSGKKIQVVFEINDPAGENNAKWTGVLNNINNSLDDIGEENMEVEAVVHGPAIDLLHREKSPPELQKRIKELQERGVVFAACNNTMQKYGYTMEDMVDGAVKVPSGVGEVIRKQDEGWIYMHP